MDALIAVGAFAAFFAGIWTVCITGAYGLLTFLAYRRSRRPQLAQSTQTAR